MTRAETETMRDSFFRRWSRVIDRMNRRCARCDRPADAFDVDGTWLCADCMFDEADPDAGARRAIEGSKADGK